MNLNKTKKYYYKSNYYVPLYNKVHTTKHLNRGVRFWQNFTNAVYVVMLSIKLYLCATIV